mmetsp:Transcript_17270/g.53102  ORF Transcript_17270/g.53102 Transcript_17270/m.53102 type:complete len:263 (-) Transcript_17270:967-1755(-)
MISAQCQLDVELAVQVRVVADAHSSGPRQRRDPFREPRRDLARLLHEVAARGLGQRVDVRRLLEALGDRDGQRAAGRRLRHAEESFPQPRRGPRPALAPAARDVDGHDVRPQLQQLGARAHGRARADQDEVRAAQRAAAREEVRRPLDRVRRVALDDAARHPAFELRFQRGARHRRDGRLGRGRVPAAVVGHVVGLGAARRRALDHGRLQRPPRDRRAARQRLAERRRGAVLVDELERLVQIREARLGAAERRRGRVRALPY